MLAVLALDGPRTRLQLADLLWEGSTKRVQQSLRTTLWSLRRVLGEDGAVLHGDSTHLRLDASRVHVDLLHPPQDLEGLLTFWQEFMTGFRYRGSEAWLEWAAATEERWLDRHVRALLQRTSHVSAPDAKRLTRRALELAPDHPDVTAQVQLHAHDARADVSDQALLHKLERVTRRLWLNAQESVEVPSAKAAESGDPLAPDGRTALTSAVAPYVDTAFVPRPRLDTTDECKDLLSTYHWRDRDGAEWIARQVLARQRKGLPAALALGVLANLAIDQGQYTRGRRLAEQALTLVPEPTSEVAFTAAYSNIIAGAYDRAAVIASEALGTLDARDTPAMLYGILARAADARQQYRAARHWHELALQAAYDQDDPYVLPQVISFMLWHHNVTGGVSRSLTLAHDGLTYGAPNFSSHLINSMGFSHLLRREFEQAHEALAPQRASMNATGAATAHSLSAVALHFAGQKDEADRTLREALELIGLTENGGVKYEWAAAALTLDPREWREQAARVVEGAVPADPTVPAWYERLKAEHEG